MLLKNHRLVYWICFVVTIMLGLLSRKVAIPAITGDALYACMVYWMFRMVFTRQSKVNSLVGAIVFCFVIEILQLVQHPLLIAVREHPYLRLIFGQGFLWTDLVAYVVGGVLAFWGDSYLFSKKSND